MAYNRIKDKITPIYKTDYSYYYEGLVKPITITFDNVQYQSNIRLIGINQDYLSETLQKAKFTFAFTDCIDAAAYDIRGVGVWYYKQGGIEHNCFLRKYLNEYLIDTLPIAIRNNIKTVKKYNGCYDITEPLTVKYVGDISQSDEKLFPLSLDEMNLPPELVT
ncbi:MAG: hypothetical protein MJ233_02660 [Mycoplasmoidaceae bacterium]|nr:hypothetical protein [Mycoplasmoidaceae bacterium]